MGLEGWDRGRTLLGDQGRARRRKALKGKQKSSVWQGSSLCTGKVFLVRACLDWSNPHCVSTSTPRSTAGACRAPTGPSPDRPGCTGPGQARGSGGRADPRTNHPGPQGTGVTPGAPGPVPWRWYPADPGMCLGGGILQQPGLWVSSQGCSSPCHVSSSAHLQQAAGRTPVALSTMGRARIPPPPSGPQD